MTPKKKPKDHFEDIIGMFNLPVPEKEYVFHPTRKWRFDYVWNELNVAVEIQGGRFHRGNPAKDYEKLNEAQSLGWSVYQFGSDMFNSEPGRVSIGEFMQSVLGVTHGTKEQRDED